MKRRYKPLINHNSEFELDLAPLLAVMVKLVPVLLVSSAFVQMTILETELPQAIQQAIAKQDEQKNTGITLTFSKGAGTTISWYQNGEAKTQVIPILQTDEFDYPNIHRQLEVIKAAIPDIFKIEFKPGKDVSYNEIIKMMDYVRQSKNVQFEIKNQNTGKIEKTPFMFPEVVFTGIFEG